MRWLEAVVDKSLTSSAAHALSVVVELPGGARFAIASPGQAEVAAALLRAWEKAAPAC